jgi:choline transport protein
MQFPDILIRLPDFVIQGWHGALLTMAYVLSAILFNTYAIGKMPVLEGLAVILHVFGFFAFLIIFWVMGPRAPAEQTLTTFSDDNGWGSLGLATLIGMVGPTTTYLGADSAVHLAEELKDASYILPRAMFSAAIINCEFFATADRLPCTDMSRRRPRLCHDRHLHVRTRQHRRGSG